jgi:hypothetical protein
MITPKHASLQDILNSKGGLHLSAYVHKGADPAETRLRLIRVIYCAINQMHQCTSYGKRREFLSPLVSLLRDNLRVEMLPKRFALFRNESSFRIISLPDQVEEQCFVADSFHVKPLLGWIQADEDMLVLALDKERATLYAGTRGQLRLVSEFESLAPQGASGGRDLKWSRAEVAELTLDWLEEQLSALPRGHRPRLYILGGRSSASLLAARLRYRFVDLSLAGMRLGEQSIADIWAIVQRRHAEDTEKRLVAALKEIQRAEEAGVGRRNLVEIATEAARGRVAKLLVAGDLQIFGKMDRASGRLRLTGSDVDHEDDDILDDLAQMVLAKGGKVHVVPAGSIPNTRPAFALLREPKEARSSGGEEPAPSPTWGEEPAGYKASG